MSVRTPLSRDRSSTIIETTYDPQLPKDMFGFPVDRKFAGAYQEFLSIHLTQSLKQNDRISEAIQQGIIDTTLPKNQWGIIRSPLLSNNNNNNNNNNYNYNKKERPLLQRMLPVRTASSRNLHIPDNTDNNNNNNNNNNNTDNNSGDRKKFFAKSRSIGNLIDTFHISDRDKDKEKNKMKERKSLAVSNDLKTIKEEEEETNNREQRTIVTNRQRSNSDLKAYLSPLSPSLSPSLSRSPSPSSSSLFSPISSPVSSPSLFSSPVSSPPSSPSILQAFVNFMDFNPETPEEVVRNIIRGGIPANYRAELWLALSGVSLKLPVLKGVYQTLLDSLDKPVYLESLAYEQIEKDLSRTFPGIDFTPAGHEFQPTLRRILRAYVVRNPILGYCQSMNFIAGGLLIFMEEEHAFCVLTWVVEELLSGYFSKSMIGLQVDTLLFEKLLKKNLPDLHKHLSSIGFNTILCTVQWFLCIFMTNLPSEAAFRVWDMVFLSGVKALFEVALNVMKLHENQIMRKRDAVDIASFLSKSLTCCFDATPLVANNFLKGITAEEMKKQQKDLYNHVQLEARSRHDTLQMIELLRLTRFDKEELAALYTEFSKLDPMLTDFGINFHVFTSVIPYAFPFWNAVDDHFAQQLFAAFDCDNDSMLDFKELMMGLSAIYRGQVMDKLQVCCRMFGATNSSKVQRDQLRKLLFSIYKAVERTTESQISREVAFFEDMFYRNDKNNEGITADLFKEFIILQPAVVKCFNLSRPIGFLNVHLISTKT